jgi:hypothetical protein
MAKRTVARIAKRALKADDAARAEVVKTPGPAGSKLSHDSYANFRLSVGVGTDNNLGGGYNGQLPYSFLPVTRWRQPLEWAFRGSWVCKVAVSIPADDMTREGVDFLGDLPPEDGAKLREAETSLLLWKALNRVIKWSRLYGGAIGYLMIDGQDPSTPLRVETIGKGQFKGILPLDRWQIQSSVSDLVTEKGPFVGLPKYYTILADAPALPRIKIHHTRCIRLIGVELPYWQSVMEQGWGLSVLEPLWDRLLAFDSGTMGAAQLMHKAHLRTYKMKGLRDAIAQSFSDTQSSAFQQIQLLRQFQSNEAIALIDGDDEFQVDQTTSFTGMADVLVHFGQQISGSLGIPLVRLFGQSPVGLNSTGESDLRNYYDMVSAEQEANLKVPCTLVYRVMARSLGITLPDGFGIEFSPLWQLSDKEKADIAGAVTTAVDTAMEAGIIDKPTAMKELKQSSETTGVYTNITEEDIEAASLEPPPNIELPPAPGEKGATGAKPALVGAMGRPLSMDELPIRYVHGMEIFVETPKGDLRHGINAAGDIWQVRMPSDYGFIRGTASAEGPFEQFDCYLGDTLMSERVWVVSQKDLATDLFDEEKAMVGFRNAATALKCYADSFSDGRGMERIMKVQEMPVAKFKAWLEREWPHGKEEAA